MVQAGRPVEADMFIGRGQEIIQIMGLLAVGQNVVLIAPRRMGKTSLVLEILSRFRKKGLATGMVDLFEVATIRELAEGITTTVLEHKKLASVFRKIKHDLAELLRSVELKAELKGHEFLVRFGQKDTDSLKLLADSLDYIDNTSKEKKMIFALDEFGDIGKLDGEQLVKLFRAKLQRHKNATYIFSGSYESVMASMFIKPNSPFFRFATIINLGYIEKDAFVPYLRKILKKGKLTLTKEQLNEALDFTKGHPYYTNLFAQQALIQKAVNPRFKYSLRAVQEAMLLVEKSYIEKTWEELSASTETRLTLLELARGDTPVYTSLDYRRVNVSRAMRKLSELGLLWKAESASELIDPLFTLWLRRVILKLSD